MQGYKGSCFCELDELFNQNLPEEYQCLLNVITVEQMSNICDTKELGGDVYYRSSSFPNSGASLSALVLSCDAYFFIYMDAKQQGFWT
jgi:hypothetical protein